MTSNKSEKTVELQVSQDKHNKDNEVDNQPTKPVTSGNLNNNKNKLVNTTKPVGSPGQAEELSLTTKNSWRNMLMNCHLCLKRKRRLI